MEQTECSKMLAYKIQTLENYPEESTQYSEHKECLKSRKSYYLSLCLPHVYFYFAVKFGMGIENQIQHYSDSCF